MDPSQQIGIRPLTTRAVSQFLGRTNLTPFGRFLKTGISAFMLHFFLDSASEADVDIEVLVKGLSR